MQRLSALAAIEHDDPLASAAARRLDQLVGEDNCERPIGVAVSGGSDSTALLHLACLWASQRGRVLLVFTVDHGLRPGAADEAETVAAACRGLGLSHQTLRWKNGRAQQSTARSARHALLAAAVRDVGGRHLLIGHTADDQLETLLMRARQGSGWYGLGGMDAVAVSPAWPEGRGVTLARPLLAHSRSVLQHWLRARGVAWVEDPSNADVRFERVRVRRLIEEASPAFQTRLNRITGRMAALRRAERTVLARALDQTVTAIGDGQFVWRRDGVEQLDREVRIISLLIQLASGTAQPLSHRNVRVLLEAIRTSQKDAGRTLGGAWIAWSRPHVLFSRDPGLAASPPGPNTIVWDGRFERVGTGLAGHKQDRGVAFGDAQDDRLRLTPSLPPDESDWRDLTGDRLEAVKASMKG
ncbi:MAG: tRNA lysidine(34) synthetase TilS [Pseudomonadota bacterium]